MNAIPTLAELKANPYAIDWSQVPEPLPDDYFTLEEYANLVTHNPDVILNDQRLFRWGIEHLFHIRDKNQRIVLLKQKEAQSRLLYIYYILKEHTGPNEMGPQICNLKSRQQGMTTYCSAITLLMLMLMPNRQALLIAHEKEKVAVKAFEIYDRFLQLLPDEFQIWNETKKRRGDGYLLMNGSSIDVEVEKKGGVVGITTQGLHLSEAGRFRYLNDFLGSFIPGMPQLPVSAAIMESTAEKNEDAFHHIYTDAERGISRWFPVFFPWYIDEDCIKPFKSPEERVEFSKHLDIREDALYGNEKWLLDSYPDITLEHLNYRRERIDSFPNRLSQFKREYPTTPEEAFLGAKVPVFDTEGLRWQEKNHCVDPLKYGRMLTGTLNNINDLPKFIEDSGGIIRLWGWPRVGYTYGICSDHSDGKNDFNAAVIVQLQPFEIIGVMMGYEGHNPIAREFAHQMDRVGRWYNDAWILPERNGPGQAVIDVLLEREYPNIVSESMIFPEKTGFDYGWLNTTESRKRGLEMLRDTIKNKKIHIPCLDIVRQLQNFVTVTSPDGTRTRDQALRKGEHRSLGSDINQFCDDLVFAMIGVEHCRRAVGKIDSPKKKIKEMKDEKGRYWIEEVVPELENIFNEQILPERRHDWRDY